MNKKQIELAKRLVVIEKFHKFRWMDGMQPLVSIDEDSQIIAGGRVTCDCIGEVMEPCDECFPDLEDPATQGCLLALLYESTAPDLEKEVSIMWEGMPSGTHERHPVRFELEVENTGYDWRTSVCEHQSASLGEVLALALIDLAGE